MRKWFFIGTIAVTGIAGLFVTVGERQQFCCIDCGILAKRYTWFGRTWERHERQRLTDWFDRKVGPPHSHEWARFS